MSKALCTIGRGGGGHVLPGKFEVVFFLSFLRTPRKMHATHLPSFVREIPNALLHSPSHFDKSPQ